MPSSEVNLAFHVEGTDGTHLLRTTLLVGERLRPAMQTWALHYNVHLDDVAFLADHSELIETDLPSAAPAYRPGETLRIVVCPKELWLRYLITGDAALGHKLHIEHFLSRTQASNLTVPPQPPDTNDVILLSSSDDERL